jgi:predicted CxxxxCH...CXXCH cytochrome family protein
MLARNPVLAALAALVLGLVACGDARPVQEGGGGGACTTCHGTSGRVGNLPGTDPNLAAAPPIAPAGEPAQVIGAHQGHLNPAATGSLTGPIACNECHVVPTDSAHATTPPAQVVQFGTLATTGGAAPTWNSPDKVTNTTCSNVYCHGNFTFGGVTGTVANTPDWTGTNQAACGSCHGLPPTSHPALAAGSTNQTCAACHDQTVRAADGLIDVPAGRHVNGQPDVIAGLPHPTGWLNTGSPNFHAYAVDSGGPASCQTCHAFEPPAQVTTVVCSTCHNGSFAPSLSTCTGCHGGIDNNTGAPPRATWGNQADTVRVGAHTSHVEGTHTLSNPVACSECHVVPTDAFSAGHIDQPTATLTWGTLATTGGANPTWTRTSATCAASYCHGSTLPAGTGTPNRTPVWTTVDGSQITCGTSCHGSPPLTGTAIGTFPAHVWHVTATGGPGLGCGSCHTGYTASLVVQATHVNGTIQVNPASAAGWTCNACH